MARAERPLDDEDSPLGHFAADLRRLRVKAGSPPYREVSRRAHYSPAALSDAASGRGLPSLAVTLAYVAACGGAVAEWERRWHELAGELVEKTADGDTEKAPYVGLAVFQPDDADRFFGREDLIEDLTKQVSEQRFVVVIGPSGSGKSSVLRAGLVHKVRSEGLAGGVVTFSPGTRPLDECAARLAALTGLPPGAVHTELRTDPRSLHLMTLQALVDQPPEADLLLVVDQFEEVFTLCRDAGERAQFVRLLRTAADAPNSRIRIVVGVRADFYGHCAQYPELLAALRSAQVPVGPMRTEELRSAVTQPALKAGLRVENGLVAQVIADATGYPGVLPMVSHALLETWRRRRGTTLTLTGYTEVGGVIQAIARTAETAYTALSQRQQRWARQLFIRLVALGDGTEDTKRRLPREELELTDPDHTTVIEVLAQARLLVLDRDSVEIAHESLIRCWPRLRDWLNTDREGARVHRQLTDAANSWESLHRDPGALYRGSRLTQADQWMTAGGADVLTTREREFLRASLAVQAAEQTTDRRRTRRLRQLLAVLAVLLVVAVSATGYATYAQHTAIDQRDQATARNALDQAAALNTTNSALALQLGLAAYRIAPQATSRSTLFGMLASPFATPLTVPGREIESTAFAPNGQVMATADLSQSPARYDVRLWSVANAAHLTELTSLTALPGPTVRLAFSPDGRILATGGVDSAGRSVVRLWDITNPRHPAGIGSVTGPGGSIASLAFSPDGRTLAIAQTVGAVDMGSTAQPAFDNEVALWDVADPRHPQELVALPGSSGELPVAAFGSAGHLLATSGIAGPGQQADADRVRLWDLSDPRHPQLTAALATAPATVYGLAFRPDDQVLAVSDLVSASPVSPVVDRNEVRLWNVADPRSPVAAAVLTGTATAAHEAAAFSSDDRTLATVASDRTIRLWDIADPNSPGELVTLTGAGQTLDTLAFNPNGHILADNEMGSVVRLTDVGSYIVPFRTDSAASAVSTRPDGRVLAVGYDGTVDLWDSTDPYHRRLIGSLSIADAHAYIGVVRFSPDGRVLAVGSAQAFGETVTFWDVADPGHPRELTTSASAVIAMRSLDFSPGNHVLVVGSMAGPIQLWDLSNPGQPHELGSFATPGAEYEAVSFVANAHTVAVAGVDGAVQLWDVADPCHPHALGSPVRSGSSAAVLARGPDGRVLAVGGADGTVTSWDVSDPEHPRRLATVTGSSGTVSSLAYRPDGQILAVGGTDGTVTLWDVSDPQRPQQTASVAGVASNFVNSLAFRAGDDTLTVGGGSYPQLLETDADQATSRICALATPRITVAEWNQYLPGIPYQPPCASTP
ncbi:MAG TPA: hypothetical protein VGN81_29310 [Pseudonocardiaceae bacterium]|jgi:WD40 repeat protein/energy-coupling factor transporter ATP-binding protein EcfA2